MCKPLAVYSNYVDQSVAACDYTVERPGLFQLTLLTSVAIRKHIKMSMYWEILLTSMRTFGDKLKGHFGDVFKWPLICEAFN